MSNVFTLLDHIKNQIQAGGLFVEFGTARDGSSTNYLAALAKETANSFITVDVNPILTGAKIPTATMSGESWVATQLPNLGKRVTLAYMDSGDWIKYPPQVRNGTAESDVINLIADYKTKGISLDNVSTVTACAQQALGLLPYMQDKSVVMLPDTSFNAGTDSFQGKGSGAAYLFLAAGFRLISASPYDQYIMLGREVQPVREMSNLNRSTLSVKYEGPKIKQDFIVYSNL